MRNRIWELPVQTTDPLRRAEHLDLEEAGMKYVQSFVMPVQKKKIDIYRKTARKFARLWKEHGALEVVETVAEDVKPGKRTSFPRSVKLKRSETVVISWVTFKSRKHRDRVMAKVMQDPRAQKLMNSEDMPGDGQRMFWGGFDVMFKV
jgi:uncharacterized protein YbaA (DUF1428 family)